MSEKPRDWKINLDCIIMNLVVRWNTKGEDAEILLSALIKLNLIILDTNNLFLITPLIDGRGG